MAHLEPSVLAHREWLGFVRPVGLVVSAPALVRAGAILDQNAIAGQRALRAHVGEGDDLFFPNFPAFAKSVLGWSFSPKFYAGGPGAEIPAALELPLPEAGLTLRPDLAIREPEPKDGASPFQLLIQELPLGTEFDTEVRGGGRMELSAHARLERLLRATGVTAGLLTNGRALRLVSAPRGESSGWLDFRIADMVQTAGRPIYAALHLLLSQPRLLALPRASRLPALLADSRKFQNEVSEKLAAQVLHALYEFLRGFQAAHDAGKGRLLAAVLADHPDEVYRALLTVILRLVFLLYAEERDLLPGHPVFVRSYSIAGLHVRLRADAALHPDTMDQRFGAWAQLLALFRMVHDGARAPNLSLPPRHGVLFDPDRFPFLEGREPGVRQLHETIEPPLVSDGTIYRALEKLLVLEGERLSYRALDVEQIGSVYETMMGFRLETATGRSLAIRSAKKQGAPTTVNLDTLLGLPKAGRAKKLEEAADRKIPDGVKKAMAAASSLEDLHAALQPILDQAATPDLVPPGAMVLQPSEERRRSGSHYTPRELTEPIVRTTLDPILARLRGPKGTPPRPEAILDLKVCDPAMGSGAFLVETCRYLGDALVDSWRAHQCRPPLPPDEDELVFARRLVAQRCLYGVDRNPVAVDLAKLSLWLATLARDHALTFVDHALRHGDSLVGLSRRQLECFHWEADAPSFQQGFESVQAAQQISKVSDLRRRIREAGDETTDRELRDLWDQAQFELDRVRLLGDLAISAFFEADKPKLREAKRLQFSKSIIDGNASQYRSHLADLRTADPPLAPFHWEIEFPEVFDRPNPGFDAFVGNPPFAGKNSVSGGNLPAYPDWLKEVHPESHGNADLVAHFFRRAFDLLRSNGTLGLIATNTIAQGDTRSSGLRWLCTHGGEIYSAERRVKWPGLAAVIVSVVHVQKGPFAGSKLLDGHTVPTITAFLFSGGSHDDPERLPENSGKSFVGSYVLGMGFTFDDSDPDGIATPIAEMHRILAAHPECKEVIFPYIGGSEVNTSPTHSHHRYVINFGERSEDECRRRWPALISIVESKVKGERGSHSTAPWWQFERPRTELLDAIGGSERVLAIARISKTVAFTFLPSRMVHNEKVVLFPFSSASAFCALQSRVHEVWARFFSTTLKDDLQYTPTDCFETFPFPESWENSPQLEAVGREYYEFRAALMVKNNEGLTKTYNRFHDPDETSPDILQLRSLHLAMDRAVLAAYNWSDLSPTPSFLLDYDDPDSDSSSRKKPYRLRFPDPLQSLLLSRLLSLNSSRSKPTPPKPRASLKSSRRKQPDNTGDLF